MDRLAVCISTVGGGGRYFDLTPYPAEVLLYLSIYLSVYLKRKRKKGGRSVLILFGVGAVVASLS